MKLFKVLMSSLVLLLVGCEELGIDLEDVERVAEELELDEYDITLTGLEPLELMLGQDFDLEEGVKVSGADEYELIITNDIDRKRPGGYVARYRVLIGSLVVYDETREVIVLDKTEVKDEVDKETDTEVDKELESTLVSHVLHIIGEEFDLSVCDGVDDDCDGIVEGLDLSKEGMQFIVLEDMKIPVFVVEPHNLINADNMRIYNNRKLNEQELKAIDISGELYTMHKLIEANPLATGGTVGMLSSYVEVSEMQKEAFMIIDKMHLEALREAMMYFYPELGDEVLVCFQEEEMTRISLNMDTSMMKAKEKANKTKCSSNLRMYFDDTNVPGLGDMLYLDRLRNSDESFRTDSFFDIHYLKMEETIGRELTQNELRSIGGIDNDCDGYCEIDPFEALIGRFYTEEHMKYTEFLDLREFISGEYEANFDIGDMTIEVKPIRLELAAYRYINELEEGFGHDLSKEEIDAVLTRVAEKFKAGADLSSKVNLRGVNPLYEEGSTETVNPLFEEMVNRYNVREELTRKFNHVYLPGNPVYGQMVYTLGRDLKDIEIEALLTMSETHMMYYDNGGAVFLEASIDEIVQVSGTKLSDVELQLLEIYQTTLQAQDYNSSRSNTTS